MPQSANEMKLGAPEDVAADRYCRESEGRRYLLQKGQLEMVEENERCGQDAYGGMECGLAQTRHRLMRPRCERPQMPSKSSCKPHSNNMQT